jgi:hypothetical protein
MRLILPSLLTLALANGQALSTKYDAEQSFRIEVQSAFTMEMVDFSMERDGEPMDTRGGGRRSSQAREIVMIDTVLDSKDGEPTHVRRAFEMISGTATSTFGENEMESESECPLSDVIIEIVLDDGDISTEVVEGDEPEDEALLEGHNLTLALDALLPEDEVEADDSWGLDGEALLRAMGLDVEKAYFPPPSRDEGEGRGERRGGGRRGMPGMRGGGESIERYVTNADWDAEATLESGTEEYNGLDCHVIRIEAEATGELPEREWGGRDRQDRSFRPLLPALRPENSFEFELEGKLYFSVEGGHPVHLELEGTVSTESMTERERGESVMVISRSQEGSFEYSVDITPVTPELEDGE